MTDGNLDISTFMADLAQYMQKRDAVTTAYALVCNPARQYDIISAIEEGIDKAQPLSMQEIARGSKAIAIHNWCPLDTIYLPQSKDEYDELMARLDRLAEKMAGRVCIMSDCAEPAADTWDVADGRKMGMCAAHQEEALRGLDAAYRVDPFEG